MSERLLPRVQKVQAVEDWKMKDVDRLGTELGRDRMGPGQARIASPAGKRIPANPNP